MRNEELADVEESSENEMPDQKKDDKVLDLSFDQKDE